YRMSEGEIRLRAQSFARHHKRVALLDVGLPDHPSQFPSGAILPDELRESFSGDEIPLLLSDLCAGEMVANLEAGECQRERAERMAGAVFYLAACHPRMIERTRELWKQESGFVRYFRKYLYTSPSDMTGEADRRHPDWARVGSRLASLLSEELKEFHEQAIILEQAARKSIGAYTPQDAVADRVDEFWQFHREKLVSGFPFYSFRSRFVYWWKQCAENWRAKPLLESLPAEMPAASTQHSATARNVLTPDDLRVQREGYRLVRATFFPRQDRKGGGPDAPVDDDYENERLRRALDQIWYNRLQALTDDEIPRLAVGEIIERHPFLNEATIHGLTRRIRLRMWAYTLARLNRLTNDRILAARRRSGKRGNDLPLANEPGVLTIASLARMIPSGETLLGAFTAHIFLHPKVAPQRPNPLSFVHYIRELWWWVTAETFTDALRRGAEAGSLSHRAALRASREKALGRIIESLRMLRAERELEIYISGRDFGEERSEASRLVGELLGGDEVCEDIERRIRDWRARASQHWIVPVWYLRHIERLSEQEVPARLVVDEREVDSLFDLYQAMGKRH
ncbi:MAG TPA: hypothetical protein VNO14_10755, partial [Blastocatellia bacterium]|nr:hypothetical protein [Blastocatellia bacterium]